MIQLRLNKVKRIKLRDLFPTGKNLLRTNVIFNYKKFRERKWRRLRGMTTNKFIYKRQTLKRFNLNEKYFIKYREGIFGKLKFDSYHVKVWKKYRRNLMYRKRMMVFFHALKAKSLKKLLVYRHFTFKFDSFDRHIVILLLRLGFIMSIKEGLDWIRNCGGINKKRKPWKLSTRYMNDPWRVFDFGDIFTDLRFYELPWFWRIYFIFKDKIRYGARKRCVYTNILTRIRLWISRRKKRVGKAGSERKIVKTKYYLPMMMPVYRVFPMPFPVNYQNLSFYFMSFELKNQWHFYYNFFLMKKFLQYGR